MRRLSLSLLVVVLLATIGLGWAIDRLFVEFDSSDADSLQVYRQLGSSMVSALDGSAELARIVGEWQSTAPVQLHLLNNDELSLPPELQLSLDQGQPLTLESDTGIALYFAMPRSKQVLALLPPAEPVGGTRLRFALTIVFYAGIILLILTWLYPLVRRLQTLATTAKAFGEGRLDQRVPTHKHSNLSDIEAEFNNMASRIQRLVADNKLLSSAVSHDLRTPLARLRFGIDALSETHDEAIQASYLTRISADLTAMEQLVEVLLEYARLDHQLSDLPLLSVDLSELINTGVEALVAQGKHRIEWQKADSPVGILAHVRYAEMLINNVLQNAINHGHSMVRVTIHREDDRVWVCVEDDGPGIPIEDRAEVLKPFVRGRGEDSTHKGHRGFGMGVAIVNRIAEWHGAIMEIGSGDVLPGACIRVGFQRTTYRNTQSGDN
jgi:two-component system OmpR family sensor kinase